MANTIKDKLAYLEETKGLIKQAIVAKGVDVSDTDTFRSYANKIEAIQSGGSGAANIPDGTKFGYSTFTTVPDSIIPYLEQQNDLSSMFMQCNELITVPLFSTKNVVKMESMFNYCRKLTSVPQFDTSRVTNMSFMFGVCESLISVPLFETSSVTNMKWMFSDCEALETVPHFKTSRVNDMSYMLRDCYSLTTVPQFDTSRVTNMEGMFNYCEKLTSVPLLNVSSANNTNSMFWGCRSLTNLEGLTGLKSNLNLSSSPLLTTESVMNVINAAADMTSSPKTLSLHQDVFNKLSQEQIATASAKGWNIAAR